MNFLYNSWYCAGWSKDLTDKPKGIRMLNEYLVIYRGEKGQAIASTGRCPHRFAPLDQGVVRGDIIACPYHGLEYDAKGACVLNPHGDGVIPPRAKLKSYPVRERNAAIWVWMGDEEKADDALLPPETEAVSSDYASMFSYLLLKSNYQLIIDNLLDLSHARFLHKETLATDGPQNSPLVFNLETDGDVLIAQYKCDALAPAMAMNHGFTDPLGALEMSMRWRPASTLELNVAMHPLEGGKSNWAHLPSLHYLTPETEHSTHYFVGASRNWMRDDHTESAHIGMCLMKAFAEEDEPMIRAVESLMGTTDLFSLRPAILQTDVAGVQARRVLARKIEEEAGATAPAVD